MRVEHIESKNSTKSPIPCIRFPCNMTLELLSSGHRVLFYSLHSKGLGFALVTECDAWSILPSQSSAHLSSLSLEILVCCVTQSRAICNVMCTSWSKHMHIQSPHLANHATEAMLDQATPRWPSRWLQMHWKGQEKSAEPNLLLPTHPSHTLMQSKAV